MAEQPTTLAPTAFGFDEFAAIRRDARLLPCPHCGSQAEISCCPGISPYGGWRASCLQCGAAGPCGLPGDTADLDSAVAAWNRRHVSPALAAVERERDAYKRLAEAERAYQTCVGVRAWEAARVELKEAEAAVAALAGGEAR